MYGAIVLKSIHRLTFPVASSFVVVNESDAF